MGIKLKITDNGKITTLRTETFAGRNFLDFRDFSLFSQKLMPGKKLNEKAAKIIQAKKELFQKSR